jgi:hypothetical protein
MANNAIIKRNNGDVIELSNLTDQLVRELLGVNSNNGSGHTPSPTRQGRPRKQSVSVRINDATPDYAGFKKALSDSGRKFIEVLRQHPNGILADDFAVKMGLKNAVQIGGITGGGLAKLANRFNVELRSVYTVEKRFENGTRSTTYKPGRDITRVQ